MAAQQRNGLRWSSLGFIFAATLVAQAALWSGIARIGPDARGLATYIVALIAGLALAIWFLLLSGIRWYMRIAVLALGFFGVIGSSFALIAGLRFDGNLMPLVRWRWQKDPEEAVEAHRRQRGEPAVHVGNDLTTVTDADWPAYRGVLRDGVVRGPKLARDWKKQPPKELWRQPCGLGWSSFAIVGDFAVTMEQRKEVEVTVAYDVGTGREIWKYEHPARFDEVMGGIGPRATPTIAHGDVFSLGAEGHLACLDGKSGKPKWTKDILEGGMNLRWAMAGSPLVVGDLVIVNPGNQLETKTWEAVLALDRKDGHVVWKSGWTKGGYSSPMLAKIAGVEQVVLFDGKQVAGFEMQSGKELWRFPWANTQQDINVAQPVVFSDGRVFITSGYATGCAMVQVSKDGNEWSAEAKFNLSNRPLRCKFTSPVVHGEYIYGLDEGILACIRASDAKLQWKDGRYGHGQVLRWEDLLIVSSDRGDLVLVDADPKEFRELGRRHAIDGSRCWNVPAIANGRILVRNEREMACFDLREVAP